MPLEVISEAEAFSLGQGAVAIENATVDRPIRAHSHDFAELAFVRAGHGQQHMERGAVTIRPGTVMLLAPGSWHAYQPHPSLDITNVYLSKRVLHTELAWLAGVPRIGTLLHDERHSSVGAEVVTLELDAAAQASVEASLDQFAAASSRGTLYRLARFFDLLDILVSVTGSEELVAEAVIRTPRHPRDGDSAAPIRYRPSVTHAVSLLHAGVDHAWTLSALAEEVSLSTSQLARVFKADTGTSPMAYLQQVRVERFGYLLRTTHLTVAAAGRAVGWDDPSYAARRFQSHWKTTPTAYRDRLR